MTYSRAGRPSANVKGQPLVVQDLDMTGVLIKTYSKAGRVPNGYFQIRSGVKTEITQEEFELIQSIQAKKK